MVKLLSVLQKVDNCIYAVQKAILLLGVVAMIVINGAQVFCRYVIHSSLFWSEQISILLFFILIMLGANLAVKTDSETKIDVLKFKNPKAYAALSLVTNLICVIALVVFLASSRALLQQASQFPQYLSSIHLNYFYIYLWLPIGFSLVLFDKIINILKNICCLAGADISGIYPLEAKEADAE